MNTLFPTVAACMIALGAPLAAADDATGGTAMAPADVLPSSEDTISKFRNAGAWTIHRNETRKSCFASYEAENGSIVQFGFTKNEKIGYLGLFSQDVMVEEGVQDITVIANGNRYVGESTGVAANLKDGYQGGYMLVNNRNFVVDIEAAQELVAFPETPDMYVVDMTGSANAVYEVRKCTGQFKG